MKEPKKITKIQELLNERRWKQKELIAKINECSKTGVNVAMISNICNGKRNNYHLNTLIKICFALNVTPNDILDPEDFKHLFKTEFLKNFDEDGQKVS
jgi:DNA-binding Xre family transcriptional regulator